MRIAHLLSGGVDSSVALHRLIAAGHDVTAFYLKIWLEDELAHLGECPWEDDLRYARQVCDEAGVELRVMPLQREYRERVVSWALGELRAGRTPSPDVLCNRRIKFGAFFDLLQEQDGTDPERFDRVASGHYARVEPADDLEDDVRLLRGVDPVKDQTYFLFRLRQDQLRRLVFPLGGLTKSQVRAEAEGLGLPNRHRKDSQGLCFLGKVPFSDFVEAHLGERPGPIRRIGSGEVLGRHRGHWFHTVGQRRGLGLHGGPWYVVGKMPAGEILDDDVAEDTVWVCHGDELDRHARTEMRLVDPHWIRRPAAPGPILVRVRHGPRLAAAVLESVPGTSDAGLRLRLEEPDPGLAPGQVAVLYRGDECLGGATIQWKGGKDFISFDAQKANRSLEVL